MTGGDHGKLYLFGDLEAGKTGSLSVIDNGYGSLDVGNRSAPALADLDGDEKFELLAGNQRGGLELFHTELLVGTTGIVQPVNTPDKPYQIMQSTTENLIEIVWKNNLPGRIELFDAFGRSLDVVANQNEIVQEIHMESFPPGIYFIRLQLGQKMWVEKVGDSR